jgi:hypothetical protein
MKCSINIKSFAGWSQKKKRPISENLYKLVEKQKITTSCSPQISGCITWHQTRRSNPEGEAAGGGPSSWLQPNLSGLLQATPPESATPLFTVSGGPSLWCSLRTQWCTYWHRVQHSEGSSKEGPVSSARPQPDGTAFAMPITTSKFT